MTDSTLEAKPYVLAIEDSPGDARLLQEALRETGLDVEFEHVQRGREGLDRLVAALKDDAKPRAALVLLDLDLPDMNGIEVLRQLKQHPATRWITVVVVSGDGGRATIRHALERHANAYICKTTRSGNFLEAVTAISSALLQHSQSPF